MIKIEVTGDAIGVLPALPEKLSKAMSDTASDAAQQLQDACRSNIAGSGNFTGEWVEGLTVEVELPPAGGFVINGYHSLGAMTRPHMYGATIFGNPLLWIPFSNAPEAKNIRARDYPGRLFRVDRTRGPPPLLFGVDDQLPKYTGLVSVTIPKRWDIEGQCKMVAAKIPDMLAQKLGM